MKKIKIKKEKKVDGVRVSFKFKREIFEKLKKLAIKHDISRTKVIEYLIERAE